MAMDGMPRPNEHHKRLHQLAGHWIGEERLNPSPGGPAGAAIGRITMRVDIDGFFLLQDYVEEREEQIVYRGHGIFGWEDPLQSYGWYWVDSMGSMPIAPARGHWQGSILTFEHVPVADQRGRYTFSLVEQQRTLLFTIENSRDGGHTYTTFLEGRYRRI